MRKNISIACGLGDLFTFLTRLDNFFENNPEYNSIKFWTWLHHPKLAKELVSLDKHDVEIFSVDQMVDYLENHIPEEYLESAREHFIKQNFGGVGVDKYLKFMNTFFPNIEEWIYLPVYNKYRSQYPYKLENITPKVLNKKHIVVHPFSTTVKTEKPERTWSTKRWGGLLNIIKKYYPDFEIVLIGTSKDKIEGARDFSTNNFLDLRGKISLTESIEYIYGASFVLGINSWSTAMSAWAGIPTYSQWFVQHQLIPTHFPPNYDKMNHIVIEYPKSNGEHPKVEEVWRNVRKAFNAATSV